MSRDRGRFSDDLDQEEGDDDAGPKVVLRRSSPARRQTTETESEASPINSTRSIRRLPLVLFIGGLGVLAAIPFRAAEKPSSGSDPRSVSPPRIAPSPVSLVELDEGPALPRSIPFAGQERDASAVAERPKPLPAPTAEAPPEIADRYEPLVSATEETPSFLEETERQASAVLPEHLQGLARAGRWPIETRSDAEAPPEIVSVPPLPDSMPQLAPTGSVPTPAPSDSAATSVSATTPTPAPSRVNSQQGTRWRVYKIRDGDTLESIATKFLSDPGRSQDIYRANQELLPSPEALPLGTTIVIPPAY